MNFNGMLKKDAIELLADQPALDKGTSVFVRIPDEDQQPCMGDGMCCCPYCSPQPRKSGTGAKWDTVVITDDRQDIHVYTVHAPDLWGARRKR